RFPEQPGEDAYSYLSCVEAGFKFYYQRQAAVFYRSPQNFSDHLQQSIRFLASRKNWKKTYAHSESHYFIPKTLLLREIFQNFIRHPILLSVYGAVFVFARVRSIWYRPTTLWEISRSSKILGK